MAKKKVKKVAKHPTKDYTAPKTTTLLNDRVEDVIAAALCAAPSSVLMKVCRLCEAKDGPFLNIFDAEKVVAKKIEDLMPFAITEDDKLPHKICFRCSAKVEELHEFIQRCIKAQENLRSVVGEEGPLSMKRKSRVQWENKMQEKKVLFSNSDICDVLIHRAMEGMSIQAPIDESVDKLPPPSKRETLVEESTSSDSESDEDGEAGMSLKQVKQSIEKSDTITTTTTRVSRSSLKAPEELLEGLAPPTVTKKAKTAPKKPSTVETKPDTPKAKAADVEVEKEPITEKPKQAPPEKNTENKTETKPFNIMDHVCTIKVNQVGVLFQCKLCNRNFLKKEIVMNHGCAKNHVPPKETSSASLPTPGPPKPPTVQYIKMDTTKKPLSSLVDKPVEKAIEPPKPAAVEPEAKPKPKIGPASRVRAKPEPPKEPTPPANAPPVPEVSSQPALTPAVTFPTVPSLSSRYMLVPGPNNTFQLVEEPTAPEEPPEKQAEIKNKKRKSDTMGTKSKHRRVEPIEKSSSPEIIDLDDGQEPQREPYPVGLFRPVPHHSSVTPAKPPVQFTTPAMKKQSYTIVQTGNPSKLLISTKPQHDASSKKKSKKKTEAKETEAKETESRNEEDPPVTKKDPGFFTFVSLDASLQPSFVLPTDNIIQESQITTSSSVKPAGEKEKEVKEAYPCNMCGEKFSREKKLLAHIQSHYNQMDEEDELRTGKPGPKRRTRKS